MDNKEASRSNARALYHKKKLPRGFGDPIYTKRPKNAKILYFMGEDVVWARANEKEAQLVHPEGAVRVGSVGRNCHGDPAKCYAALMKRKSDHEDRTNGIMKMKILGILWGGQSEDIVHDKLGSSLRIHTGKGKAPVRRTNGDMSKGSWYRPDDKIREYIRELVKQPYVFRGEEGIKEGLAKLKYVKNINCWVPFRDFGHASEGRFDLMTFHDGTWSSILDREGPSKDSYFTPDIYTEGVREVMGAIDLDPASCDEANNGDANNDGVQAKNFYDIDDDGLSEEWFGRVFLNPPFKEWDQWSLKAYKEWKSGRVTQMVVFIGANSCVNKNFERLKRIADAVFIPDGRDYGNTWGPKSTSGSFQGHFLFYFGPKVKKFNDVFSKYGSVFCKGR